MAYTLSLTTAGQAKIVAAITAGTQVTLTQLAVGSSSTALTAASTALGQERYRAAINNQSVVGNAITMTALVPSTQGGWYIRELGVFDADGVLIAFAAFPETYKPLPSTDSVGVNLTLTATLNVINAANVSVTVTSAALALADLSNVNPAAGRASLQVGDQNFVYAGSSGLTATFGAGKLVFCDGSNASFAGGSVVLQPSATNFIMLDLHDMTLHALRKGVHTGAVLVATVITGGSSVTSVVQPSGFAVPSSAVERTKRKAGKTDQLIRVALIGDSLTEGAGGTPYWHQLLFDSAQSASGFNVPNVDNWTKLVYASGGQTAHYGWAMCGMGVTSGYTGLNHATQIGIHYDAVQALEARGLNMPAFRSPILSDPPDIAIVSFGANGGTYSTAFVENIVRELRARGVEVILHTSNFNTGNLTGLVAQSDDFAALAEAYGCDLADTNSYLYEAYANGSTVFSDSIHPNAAGHVIYAKAIRSVFNDRKQRARIDFDSLRPRIITTASAVYSGRFPNDVHVCFNPVPSGSTGSDIASVSSSAVKNAAILFGGKAAASGTYQVETGETCAYHHSGFLAVDMLIEQNSAFTVEVRTGNGNTLHKTITHTAGNDSIGLKEVFSLTEVAALGGYVNSEVDDWLGNAGLEFRVTAGTLKLVGVVFHVPKQRTLMWNEVSFKGTWAQETCNGLAATSAYYTDTLNDSLRFCVEGTGCQVLMQRRQASGQVTVYVDGKQYGSIIELYRSSGQFIYPLNIDFAALGNVKDRGYGRHFINLVYSGTNGSAASPSAGDRRLTIGAIKAIDAR